MPTEPEKMTATSLTNASSGRSFFWLGIALCFLGMILVAVQYSAGSLIVPWYSPIMATVGAGLLLSSFVRRKSTVRFIVLGLIGVLTVLQWYFLLSLSKLPVYAGAARAGERMPSFRATRADGQSFTEEDLSRGMPTVLTLFRGRW